MSTNAIDDVLLTTATVSFPPRQYADFLIHYDSTAFFVHKLVLHTHSNYFCTFF